jgi:hypothetical protein
MNLITYNTTSNITSFAQAIAFTSNAMTQATGYDVFGIFILLGIFAGAYMISSKYSFERSITFSLFIATVAGFIMVSGHFLDPVWLMITIILLMVSVFAANRVN